MAKTSISDPIGIDEVAAAGGGVVGITFCPGKKQPNGFSGAWDRDLGMDLDAIRSWGAAAVVTLVEDHELKTLKVADMGDEVAARGMLWFHMPIVDQKIPIERFEIEWTERSQDLHAILDAGGKVLVHCKGGQGRAGTIAARLLIERGSPAFDAIRLVRAARRGAVENPTQEGYLHAATGFGRRIQA